MIRKLILASVFLGLLFSLEANNKQLERADSLFSEQKFTEAFEIYEKLYLDQVFSPSMLLKMAFIQDGLGNYVRALYFLDTYYQFSADRSAVTKIEEISIEKNLVGYNYTDFHFFSALYNRFRSHIQLLLVSLSLFLLVYVFKRKKQNEWPVTATVFQLLVLGALLVSSNSIFEKQHGIIISDHTLLRSGPSAGAQPITMIEQGHKVEVLERSDIWTKIRWDGEVLFVRNQRILSI